MSLTEIQMWPNLTFPKKLWRTPVLSRYIIDTISWHASQTFNKLQFTCQPLGGFMLNSWFIYTGNARSHSCDRGDPYWLLITYHKITWFSNDWWVAKSQPSIWWPLPSLQFLLGGGGCNFCLVTATASMSIVIVCNCKSSPSSTLVPLGIVTIFVH